MARARRAKSRPSRVVVPVLIALAALAAVIAWQVVPHPTNAQAGGPPSAAPGDRATSASSTPEPTSSSDAGAATAQLTSCRERVAKADDVLAAAKTGVGHWSEHVQAQTDANARRISAGDMSAIFARTRLAGPADQDRYQKALDDYEDADGSCSAVAGASTKDAAALTSCRERAEAQQPVLKAADAGMADWQSHLAAMMRSRMHHVDDAEQIWLDAWKAAPPHIEAYDEAAKTFRNAPDC